MSSISDFDGGEPVYKYTREQAIADGMLADLSADYGDLARQLGIVVHIAMTSTAFDAAVWPVNADRTAPNAPDRLLMAGECVEQRVRRLLNVYAHSVRRQHGRIDSPVIMIAVPVLHAPGDWREIDLQAHSGPGDHGEQVLTFMLPGES